MSGRSHPFDRKRDYSLQEKVLHSSNTWTWKFLPGLVAGYLLSWWVAKSEPKVKQGKGRTTGETTNTWSGGVPQSTEELKMVLCVNDELKMGKGKIAAQCAHAAVGVVQKYAGRHSTLMAQWEEHGQAKIALRVPTEAEMMALMKAAAEKALPIYLVRDAGRTQIPSGSKTVLAVGPGRKSDIDAITGHLKLL